MQNHRPKRPLMIQVEGILIPMEWDDQGTPTLFGISTNDEKIFLLYPGGPTTTILKADIKSRVRIRGHLIEAPDVQGAIQVTEYANLDQTTGKAENGKCGEVDILGFSDETDPFRQKPA